MKTYSLSNLTLTEKREIMDHLRKRRNFLLLISLLIVTAPITVSLALWCNNNLNYIASDGTKTGTSGLVVWFYIIAGGFMPIIIVPILRFISPLGYAVLGLRIAE